VGPNYFRTIGAPVLLGRGIEQRDGPGAPLVAVINQTMAKRFFEGTNPLGRQIQADKYSFTIVGVVKDVREQSVRDEVTARYYRSFLQPLDDLTDFNFELRTAGEPAAVMDAVRRAVRQEDPGARIFALAPVAEQIGDTLREDRLVARLSALFGAVALGLAAFGLYGVLSYNVARRAPEIGIRMALGASVRGVIWMVLGEALSLTVVGLALGVPIAVACGRLISSRLFEVSASDPVALGAAAAAMLAVSTVAAWLPARRAAMVDPMLALRYE